MSESMPPQQEISTNAEIMVIDDNPANLQLLIQILREKGYQLRSNLEGTDALLSIQANAPDLILLDILMPGLSGYELCKRLKSNEQTREIPVIFISSLDETANKVKAFEMGGVDYIIKPIQRKEVLARVETHLALARLQRQLRKENERFRRLEDATFDGLVIHRAGRILEVNQSITRLFGYVRDELLGRTLPDFTPPEYHETIERHLQTNEDIPYELEVLGRDGRRYAVEAQSRSIPWLDGEARVTVIRDLSERRQWEQKARALEAENSSLRAGLSECDRLGELLGKSPAMHKVYERLIQAAASREIVMIYGETGSGKELAARTIFQLSEHHTACFVAVNCGAVPESLFEAQFFGYRKGAFTGAAQDTEGFFGQAEGGTLFLDEVGELTLRMQTKLLRVLNDGCYTPIGAPQSRRANVRIIAATNRELREMVKEGTLREDFFHRLHVIAIELPSLRRHKEDIPLLIEHFRAQQAEFGDMLPAFPAELLRRFLAYEWPGNVRELFNELRRWSATGEVELSGEAPAPTPNDLNMNLPFLQDGLSLKEALKRFETFYLKRSMALHDEHRGRAAEQLGIDRRTLYRKLKRYEEEEKKDR